MEGIRDFFLWMAGNVKYGEAGHHRDAGHMTTVVKKGNNSTNS